MTRRGSGVRVPYGPPIQSQVKRLFSTISKIRPRGPGCLGSSATAGCPWVLWVAESRPRPRGVRPSPRTRRGRVTYRQECRSGAWISQRCSDKQIRVRRCLVACRYNAAPNGHVRQIWDRRSEVPFACAERSWSCDRRRSRSLAGVPRCGRRSASSGRHHARRPVRSRGLVALVGGRRSRLRSTVGCDRRARGGCGLPAGGGPVRRLRAADRLCRMPTALLGGFEQRLSRSQRSRMGRVLPRRRRVLRCAWLECEPSPSADPGLRPDASCPSRPQRSGPQPAAH